MTKNFKRKVGHNIRSRTVAARLSDAEFRDLERDIAAHDCANYSQWLRLVIGERKKLFDERLTLE